MFPNPFKLLWSWLVYRYAKLAGFKTWANVFEQDERDGICATCPFYDAGICLKCGCLTIAKVMLTTEQCPIGRWKRIWIKNAAR